MGESTVRDFRLVSHGTATATLGAITLTGPARAAFRLEGECARLLVLAPGASCGMRLRFAPDTPGTARAALQWRSDATNPTTVALRGDATAPPPVLPGPAPDPTPTPPPDPGAQPDGGSGGCSLGPAVRRIDPVLPMALLMAAWGLIARRMRRGRGSAPRASVAVR